MRTDRFLATVAAASMLLETGGSATIEVVVPVDRAGIARVYVDGTLIAARLRLLNGQLTGTGSVTE